jgi:transposase-like protein
MGKRRAIAAEMKAKVALAALRGDRTINQIAGAFEVHPTQVSQWKRQLEEQVKDLFRDRRGRGGGDGERLIEQLYQQIGRLQFELDWLKKKVGVDGG